MRILKTQLRKGDRVLVIGYLQKTGGFGPLYEATVLRVAKDGIWADVCRGERNADRVQTSSLRRIEEA